MSTSTIDRNGQATASVGVLTAEVRVLMVGSRQVTLSVYRQLDRCDRHEVSPFGRVSDSRDIASDGRRIYVVGANERGELVRSDMTRHPRPQTPWIGEYVEIGWRDSDRAHKRLTVQGIETPVDVDGAIRVRSADFETGLRFRSAEAERAAIEEVKATRIEYAKDLALFEQWTRLPLIVLAGLR